LHNEQVNKALQFVAEEKGSYIIQERQTAIVIEKGQFVGMGAIDHLTMEEPNQPAYFAAVKEAVTPYAENEVIKSMLRKYLERYPHRVVRIAE
jgi:DNA polymerase III subunit epsilon